MKLRCKFIVQNVSGKSVAVAVGQDNEKFNGMIKLNDSGELIFKLLMEENCTWEEIVSRFAAQYGILPKSAAPSVLEFLDRLQQTDCSANDQR